MIQIVAHLGFDFLWFSDVFFFAFGYGQCYPATTSRVGHFFTHVVSLIPVDLETVKGLPSIQNVTRPHLT